MALNTHLKSTPTVTLKPWDIPEGLREILEIRRPSGGIGEDWLAQKLVQKYPSAYEDLYGNVIVPVKQQLTRTVFSSHLDTVHRTEGKVPLRVNGHILSTDGSTQLGADDGTGVYIMCCMIEAGVPGIYIFHRDEEVGGLGSDYIADNHILDFSTIDRAIAFDRRGTSDIIDTQFGVCCSAKFTNALARELYVRSKAQLNYSAAVGIFTDTANYSGLIPECTNISVGYENEHTYRETQDLEHLSKLIPTLIKVKWEKLPTKRDITEDNSLDVIEDIVRKYPSRVARYFFDLGFDEWELEYTLASY